MKKHNSILTFIFIIAVFSSMIIGCSKQLVEDPKARLTPGSYYKTQNDLNAAVAGMWAGLVRGPVWGFTNFRVCSFFGSDDLTTNAGSNKGELREFDRLSGSSTIDAVRSQWDGPWAAIYQANGILSNYSQVPEGTPAAIVAKNEAAGNAYFARALCYNYLVRVFGELPMVTGNIEPSVSLPRKPVAELYALIIADLQQAKTLLPTAKAQGKPNKSAASALLADVYLTMAGWPLNQVANYALAATEAKLVIDGGLYNLSTPYAQVFTTNNSPESIFAMQYSVAGGIVNRNAITSVPEQELSRTGTAGFGDMFPEINFFLNAPACTRTDATFYTTLKLRTGASPNFTWNLVPWNSPSTATGHPYYKKFRAGLVTGGVGDAVNETATSIESIAQSTNKETILLRYPQMLLIFAEASTMAGAGPTTEGYAAVNQVRTRAGLPNLTPGLSKTAFRDSVVFERAYEFAGEFALGMRWFDIQRLQMLPQIVAARSPLENPIPAGTDFSTKYLAPIPFAEMSRNPSWKQNIGY
jgi:hypothetical protein